MISVGIFSGLAPARPGVWCAPRTAGPRCRPGHLRDDIDRDSVQRMPWFRRSASRLSSPPPEEAREADSLKTDHKAASVVDVVGAWLTPLWRVFDGITEPAATPQPGFGEGSCDSDGDKVQGAHGMDGREVHSGYEEPALEFAIGGPADAIADAWLVCTAESRWAPVRDTASESWRSLVFFVSTELPGHLVAIPRTGIPVLKSENAAVRERHRSLEPIEHTASPHWPRPGMSPDAGPGKLSANSVGCPHNSDSHAVEHEQTHRSDRSVVKTASREKPASSSGSRRPSMARSSATSTARRAQGMVFKPKSLKSGSQV